MAVPQDAPQDAPAQRLLRDRRLSLQAKSSGRIGRSRTGAGPHTGACHAFSPHKLDLTPSRAFPPRKLDLLSPHKLSLSRRLCCQLSPFPSPPHSNIQSVTANAGECSKRSRRERSCAPRSRDRFSSIFERPKLLREKRVSKTDENERAG